MRYILIALAIAAFLLACVQAVGLLLVLAVMKKQEKDRQVPPVTEMNPNCEEKKE